ncbi:peptide ABC transporter substrate-binding protein [Staphylospora marina]|uniref:peptide ABC transporter substrate-binding protein n=1 Tax=Staphylospora marina TaxID=2490858 RepID=UPI000F5C0B4C|nr:peptide ABC transporter substrate-binding protein [Staphylospora marina]
MKNSRITSLLALFLALALVLTACVPGGDEKEAGTAEQVLSLIESSEPPNLDSAKATDAVSFTILNNVMEGLYRVGLNDELEPAMADGEPQISDDQLTWTIKLKDAKWSDGKPVTAKDFEYAWKRALDPATASEYAYILYPLKNAEEYNTQKAKAEDVGVKALDDKTLEIKLKAPTPYFKELLAFPLYLPQRQDIVEQYGEKYALEASNLVYNGPFVLASWQHEKGFTYKKNENYWDKDAVKLTQVNVNIVRDGMTGINLYDTGKTDVSGIPAEMVDKYKDSPEAFPVKESAVFYFEINQTKPFLKNKKVRQAIMMAIDRNTLVNNLLKNGSLPADKGLVPPDIKGLGDKKYRESASDIQIPYDPAKAKQLLQEGLKELGMSAPPRVELLTYDTTSAKKDAEFFKEQLRVNLGLDVVIASIPFKEKLERAKNGQFEINYAGWGADYNDPMTYLDLFLTDSTQNSGKYSNPEYDNLIKKSITNNNFEERIADLAKAEKILMDDAGVIPLYYRSRLSIKKPYVKNWKTHIIGPNYSLKWTYIEGK